MDPTGGSNLVGALLQYEGTRQTNRANQEMAGNQIAFQERMSNTAYQRAMRDMRKAGLNPMLAYQQGGSSTPGGAMATMQNELGSLVDGATSAQELKSMIETTKNIKADTELKEAQERNAKKQSKLLSAQADSARYTTDIMRRDRDYFETLPFGSLGAANEATLKQAVLRGAQAVMSGSKDKLKMEPRAPYRHVYE